jgi:DNA-binding NarL/FixJ family response regulator
MAATRRILIVDDHATFRLGLSALLNSVPGFTVAGEAATGTEAVAAVARLGPDVVVMDLNMPDLGGIEATERIVRAHKGMNVLVLTMFDDEEHVLSAVQAGALGYVLKTARQDEIVRAVQAVAEGEAIFGRPVAAQVRDIFAAVPARRPGEIFRLTGREREVLSLLVNGESNAAIARILVVSPKTVRNHITNIFRKLGVVDREQAVERAREAGMR